MLKQILKSLLLLPIALSNAYATSPPKSKLLFSFDDSIRGIHLIDQDLLTHRLVFSGEDHRYSGTNVGVEYNFMKYLNQKGSFRNLVLELGYSRGYLVDRYINNVADSGISEVLGYRTMKVFNNYFKKLREFNLALPEDKKIHVHGVDVERFPVEAVILLDFLKPADSIAVPDEIAMLIESIQMFARYKRNSYMDYEEDYDNGQIYYPKRSFSNSLFFDTLEASIKAHRQTLIKYYSINNDPKIIEKVFLSLHENAIYNSYDRLPQEQVYREMTMTRHFLDLLNADTISKFYGQFGSCHINQSIYGQECDWYDMKPLAKRLKNSGFPSISILLNYNSYYLSESKCYKQYFDSLEQRQVRMFKVKDSCLDESFQYLVITNKGSKNADISALPDQSFFRRKEYGQLSLTYRKSMYNFNNLNNALFGTGKPGFKDLEQFDINFRGYIEGGFFGFSGSAFASQEVKKSSSTYTLGGYSFAEHGGISLPFTDWMAMDIGLELRFNRLLLKIDNDSLFNPMNNGFDSKRQLKYTNNAITLASFVDLKFRIGRVFGLFGGVRYQLDPSYYKWRNAGTFGSLLDSSPRTSHGGLSYHFGVNLYFFDFY